MRSILSLGLTAMVASTSSAETTIAILEFGPGGSIHRTTADNTNSNNPAAAIVSLWNALHKQPSPSSKRQLLKHAGMSVVPDLFTKADAGIVLGLQAVSLSSMPTARHLLESNVGEEDMDNNVVGHMKSGSSSRELVQLASSSKELETMTAIDEISTRLQSTAEKAAAGSGVGGVMSTMDTLFVALDNDNDAALVDEQLGRMLSTLKINAASSGKTILLHLVIEEEGRNNQHRRLEDNADADASSSSSSYTNQKSMYEIQSFNLYLWTSVGLFVIISMVMSAFIAMPLMPDTLLFGETAKIGSD
jgi:hypothetical protein